MNQLARRLGVSEAVVVGLGSMLGAGVFVVFTPAVAEAGTGRALLLAVVVAGAVAFCNAISSARLAMRYPTSGGTYIYGRERLGRWAGFLAGWGFVVGKTASCAAMALTIGTYLWPQQARPVAVAAVVALTLVNLRGIAKTAGATRVLVTVTLLTLGAVAVAGYGFAGPALSRVDEGEPAGAYGMLTAAGLLFFAFAGYARIATLGEEVRDPQRTIPRAIPVALGLVLAIYLTLALVCLTVLGPATLAATPDPLAEVVRVSGVSGLDWLVRVGATVAVTGVLLTLLAGVGRTILAMARHRDLPVALAAVHPRHRVPHRAELLVAAAVIALVSFGDLRDAIGFSSFTVLTYYAITNGSALTLPRGASRFWPLAQVTAGAGLVGCLLLAVTLPVGSVLVGLAVLAVGAAVAALRLVGQR
ncbi:MAG TPA: APC family permease [Natronosporangium sp.]|nr:APC family permease [Natronosporangium sp.]